MVSPCYKLGLLEIASILFKFIQPNKTCFVVQLSVFVVCVFLQDLPTPTESGCFCPLETGKLVTNAARTRGAVDRIGSLPKRRSSPEGGATGAPLACDRAGSTAVVCLRPEVGPQVLLDFSLV